MHEILNNIKQKLAHVKNEFLNLPVPSHKSIDALSEDRNLI